MHIQAQHPHDVKVRVVVTADDGEGHSRIDRDGHAEHVVLTPLFNSVDLWQSDTVPAPVAADSTLTEVSLEPPQGGVLVRLVTIPPDQLATTSGVGTGDALAAIGAEGSAVSGETHGLHRTATIDVITVVAGELHVVLDTGETLLRTGDTLVQRATAHAWSNRTSAPATILATMYTAIG